MILNVNGQEYTLPGALEKATLLYVLREELNLRGTKKGCGTNDCGACKVLLDGEAVNSCVILAKNAQGKQIETIESMEAADGTLHPIQQAFIEVGAVQCGFCIPGMIMTAKALLDKNPSPTEEEIRLSLDNNLCRCTGYVKIVQGILLAAARMNGQERGQEHHE